ncbi:peptidase C39 family protein [Streptomyces sodiiphilus]|uniref:Peptidase C39 family protein n=1 Tax=Streptomyces sodiiphilus TaxID=226217 RepID=A0ABN2NUB0_9ACTN
MPRRPRETTAVPLPPAPRRTVLATALAALATAFGPAASGTVRPPGPGDPSSEGRAATTVGHHAWASAADWRAGTGNGTAPGRRSGLVMERAAGRVPYHDPHSGRTGNWEYATWLSPLHRSAVPAGELIAYWNATTPAGTWLRTEVQGTYTDGTLTPWYTMGIWASGDGDVLRTSVDGQQDGTSSVRTDTVAVGEDTPLRLAAFRMRLTLYRAPGSRATPVVRRLGVTTSDLPARFEVPATAPGEAADRELTVPAYSQNVHTGRYPQYDNGGEAWCSPASSQMVVEYWGHRPTAADLAWVDPSYDDPQVCHAARATYDHQYEGCGNWPFNAAYAASHPGLQAVVTRLDSLTAAERLVAAGIPVITSQSFHEKELTGAGYGTAGHLMTVTGFTALGDVIVNDPAGRNNRDVRRIYNRREFENVWLRTRRKDAEGRTRSASGGVCYLYWPSRATPAQLAALSAAGVR